MTAPPQSTYRLQLRPEFGFDHAAAIVPYLHLLNISHVYLSPVTAARPGSSHGYDVIDPTRLNPEMGGEAGFARLSAALRKHKMAMILDFVPNHMAASLDNRWWRDVLQHGRTSRHASTFDIDWRDGKVTLPLLGKPIAEALPDIKLAQEKAEWTIDCGVRLPISAQGLQFMWQHKLHQNAPSREQMLQLLDLQHYRLIDWHEAPQRLNYRRFFDINDLVGIDPADPSTFGEFHQLLERLLRQAPVAGVRLDHIDGLRDPAAYCERLLGLLRHAGLDEPVILVEKVLGPDEKLPALPGVSGTTGYEVMNLLVRGYVEPEGLDRLDALWREVCNSCDALQMRRQAKRQILRDLFPGTFASLTAELAHLADRSPAQMGEALQAYLVELSVYRSYVDNKGVSDADQRLITATVDAARQTVPELDPEAFAVLHDALTLRLPVERARLLKFVGRLQQFSGPVMAKAIEDTLFYRDARLLAFNEVGGDPDAQPASARVFHEAVASRSADQPCGLNATATHDTKRGEDARLRIAALTALAPDWCALAGEWLQSPSEVAASDRYFLLQSLLGAWPLEGPSDEFAERVSQYAVKALREAKQHSSWNAPDAAYEQAATAWLDRRLAERKFCAEFHALAQRAALLGALASLSQMVLKTTAPGVVDFYQGTELWDLSFVDPDNRRPVDYALRRELLAHHTPPDWTRLREHWQTGAVKLMLIQQLLALRRRHATLFADGSYAPLRCSGRDGERFVAFMRTYRNEQLLVVACRSFGDATAGGRHWPHWPDYEATLKLPRAMSFVEPLTGRLVHDRRLKLGQLFDGLPAVVLLAE